ncbi:MAG: Gfo/Idh/MocA family oxidoreductase [Deltaproteobacteria bacterium]|nr:Gfo/Idh/MocA family oxidoreductase [Deltaproteobacteria bacterium]MBW2071187.1 Gfo/Idh/MocA family oxidoreductase [Deltaproteobacteria bacterium]
MIRVAVVGSGYWGKNLVRNFHNLGALTIICDSDPEVLTEFQQKYPSIYTVRDFRDLLSDGNHHVDALVIASPAETHYELALQGLKAGKHVLVEKPLSLTAEHGRQLVVLAEQKQLILMVGHVLQYHPAVVRLKELVDAGELGKIQYLYSMRLNIGKIRAEENILWSFAPHDISVILMLLDEMPATVHATGGSYLQEKIPDTTLTTLDFRTGVKAHIFVSWLHPFKEQKLVVVGDRKMAVFDDLSEEKLLLYPHQIKWVKRLPVAAKGEAEAVPLDMQEPLAVECRHFLDCIANGRPARTDGREGLRVLRVLEASQESLNQNSSQVSLEQSKALATEAASSPIARAKDASEVAAAQPFIHESAYVDEGVTIGPATKIWHFCHILAGSRIGGNCTIGQNVMIGPRVTIGSGCKIQNNVSVYQGVTVEDEVFLGPSVVFTNVYNPRAHIPRRHELRPTLVKKGATLGANCTVICGTTIGRHAFVGAGAVVTRDVPDHALVVGVPARIVGWVCKCGEKLTFAASEASCPACALKYHRQGNKIFKVGSS